MEVPLELTGRVGILGRDCRCSRWVLDMMVVGVAIIGIVSSEEVVRELRVRDRPMDGL